MDTDLLKNKKSVSCFDFFQFFFFFTRKSGIEFEFVLVCLFERLSLFHDNCIFIRSLALAARETLSFF